MNVQRQSKFKHAPSGVSYHGGAQPPSLPHTNAAIASLSEDESTSLNDSSVLTSSSNRASRAGEFSRPPQDELEKEWVLFSPEASDDDDEDSGQATPQMVPSPANSGHATPLFLPAHNGSGSFLSQIQIANPPSLDSSLSCDAVERINAWRLKQSRELLTQLAKRERRASTQTAATNGLGFVDSNISEWGLPEEEEEDYLGHLHTKIAAALGKSLCTRDLDCSAQAGLNTSLIAQELTEILKAADPHQAAVKFLVDAAHSDYRARQSQVLSQALHAILDPSISLASPSASASRKTSTLQSCAPQTAHWKRLAKKLVHEILIPENDAVLEIMMGERYIDPGRTGSHYASYGKYTKPVAAYTTKTSCDILEDAAKASSRPGVRPCGDGSVRDLTATEVHARLPGSSLKALHAGVSPDALVLLEYLRERLLGPLAPGGLVCRAETSQAHYWDQSSAGTSEVW